MKMFENTSVNAAHFLSNNMNGNANGLTLNNNMVHLDNHLNMNHIYQNQLHLVGDQIQNKNATNLTNILNKNIIRSINESGLSNATNYELYSNLNKLQLASNYTNSNGQLNNYQQQNIQNNHQNLNFNNNNNNQQNTSSSSSNSQLHHHFSTELLNQQPLNNLQNNLQNFHQQNLSQHLLNGNLNNNQLPLQPKQLSQNNIQNVLCNPKFNSTHSTPTKYQLLQQQQNNLYNNNSLTSTNSTSTFHHHQNHLAHKSTTNQTNNGQMTQNQFYNTIQQQTNQTTAANLQQQQLQQLYLQLNNQNNPNILNRNLINVNHNLINRNLFNNLNTQNTDSNYYNNLNLPTTTLVNKSSFLSNRNEQFNSSFTFNSNGSSGSLSSNKSNSSGSDMSGSNHYQQHNNIEISGQLKNFKIIKQIGNGQFSTVYKAIYLPTNQYVALKCIRILELEDMKTRLDCINEISLLQRLDHHQNIIKYYTSFVEQNELYIVLELADCGDLAQLIKHFRKVKKKIPEKRIWSYFKQIADGLYHMHANCLLHRDLKPPNVFITQNGVVKLGDLGLSKYYGANCKSDCCCNGPGYCLSNKEKNNNANIDTRAVLENHFNTILSQKNVKNSAQTSISLSNLVKACTQQVRNNISDHKEEHYRCHKHLMQDEASSLIGTPFYMSKERLSENCKYDSQSDIWSIGCILYEMAALQSPFYGEKLNLVSLCQKIMTCNYPPLLDNYSVALRALVASCLDSDPKKRPDIMSLCDIAKFCSELSPKDLQQAHFLSPSLFKSLKVEEILNNDKMNQVKLNPTLNPIKNNLYSMNLNLNGINVRNNKSYGDSMTTNNLMNHNLNHLTNCVPTNQMLVNNQMINNFFSSTTNDSTYNDLQSLDSDTQDSLLKFWMEPENDKNFI